MRYDGKIKGESPFGVPDRLQVRGTYRLFCWHRWSDWITAGIWAYRECSRCSQREAHRTAWNLMGPYDRDWLLTGEWTPPPTADEIQRLFGGPQIAPERR